MSNGFKNNELSRLLEDKLNELATAWMIHGSSGPTRLHLQEIASLAEKNAEYRDIADRTRLLLEEGGDDTGVDPVTELRALLLGLGNASSEVVPSGGSSDAFAFEEDPEMLAGFVLEADEHLAAIEEQILTLEKDPSQLEIVHAVFRAFHTIKGLAGFLALSDVQNVAHEVETLLDHARNSRITISSSIVDIVLESSEYLRNETARVQAKLHGTEPPLALANADLLRRIVLRTQEALGGEISGPVTSSEVDTPGMMPGTAEVTDPTINSTLVLDSPISVPIPEPSQTVISSTEAVSKSLSPRTDLASASIRIETSKLDRLMDLVGEMVIAQSILSYNPQIVGNHDARLAGDLSQLARITGEVQRRAMSMRMMPIGPLFQKNAKLVRDLSRRYGKQVELELFGEATELDKTIAEELSDPLLHMIRNALDHGIETPEERTAKGKPAIAHLRLSAEHQAGQIVIAISDDGRGLDPTRILRKAVQNGLVKESEQLAEDEIFQLIFAPGFSTAEKITDISGRGVGMDVVRKHVESLRGDIQIQSELGRGTTFFIHLPLTLAIIEGLVIVVGKHRYIIPIFSVREMFRPTTEMISTVQGREEMILMRGNPLPLIRLHKRFHIEPRSEDICQGLVVVCEFGTKQFCLFVDDLLGRQEVVIKSLGNTFQGTRGLSGCAILGDGKIGLILDVGGIYRMANSGKERDAA